MDTVFRLQKQAHPSPLVFDSPHSGNIYPADFHHRCSEIDLRRAEDWMVDDLFSSAARYGAYLCALFPRSYIDVNRAIDDIDPELLAAPWPETYGAINPTARSLAGIGLIRRLLVPGQPLYDQPLQISDIQNRIQRYYIPYHKALEDTLNEAYYNFGQVWHINCHSMPSASATPRHAPRLIGSQVKQADFVLGDRDGTTSSIHFMQALKDFLQGLGYYVTINDPFKGLELIERYASPLRRRFGIQIEVNKALYMDEDKLIKIRNYDFLKQDIAHMNEFIADYVRAQCVDMAAD